MSAETPVERRLREMAKRRRAVAVGRVEASWLPEYERLTGALDAGREAIALLREPLNSHGWRARRAALLARCEENA